ncbi:MAG TPA: tetratricopeptide repeat protein [Terriglobales bacterium]|nr:tetratricopeptide repeat protein [Terriglobales bacterium]
MLQFAVLTITVEGQSSPQAATLQVSVRDSQGRLLSGVTVLLRLNGEAQNLTAHTDARGECRFVAVHPGTYTLRAEMAGLGSASLHPFFIQAGTPKTVNITLPPPSPDSSASLQFFDEPQFTIAGVTDPTTLGAHGSNASAPARDDLVREVVSLGSPSPAPVSGNSASAERTLREAATSRPADFDANQRLGKFLLDQGQPRQALPFLQRASRLKPADYQSTYEVALAYANSGQYEPARATLMALLARHDTAELHHLLGDVEENRRRPLQAAREYERAASLEPSEPNLFDWGAELLLHRAAEPALQVFSRGHRLFPNSVRMLLGLGVAWFAQGSYERAALYLCQASDLDPANPHPYLFLGKIQEVEASPSDDISEKVARFVRLRPEDAQANYYYALNLWKKAKAQGGSSSPEVSSLLQKAAQLDPGFGAAYLQLGMLQAEQMRYPEAISSYQRAIAADSRLPDAHYRLAQAYMRSGEQAKARAELELYNRLAKENAQQAERERSHMQQFVYTLRGQPSPSPSKE